MDAKLSNTNRTIWLCLLPAMVLPFCASLIYFVLLSESAAGKIIYTATKVFTLVWPFLAVVWILKERDRLRFKLADNFRPKPILYGILSGLVVAGALVALLQVPAIKEVLEASAPGIRAKAQALGFAKYYLLFAVFLSVFHSLIEEYYWRWFVFGNLRRVVPLPAAHLLAAVSFAAHHLVITDQFFPFWFAVALTVCVGTGGLLWSWLYHKHGTLTGAWISHLIVDAGIMWVGYDLIHG